MSERTAFTISRERYEQKVRDRKIGLEVAMDMIRERDETILALRKEVERLNSRLSGISRATNEAGAKLQAIARTVDSPAALATEAK